MSLARDLWTSVGKKFVMAVTGAALILFLLIHLAGNLLVFVGAGKFNEYSHALISNPLIYIAEVGLLILFIGHIVTAVQLTLKNRAARPQSYYASANAGRTSRRTLASSTMIFSGLVLVVFVPLHVWKLKFGAYYEGANGMRDLYRLVVEVFQNPLYCLWYIVAMSVVGFHLWHGFSSVFQSLGLNHSRFNDAIIRTGKALAALVALGFMSIPLAILVGVVR